MEKTHYWIKNGHFNLCMASPSKKKTAIEGLVTCEECLAKMEPTRYTKALMNLK